MPIGAGLAVIAFLQYRRIRKRKVEDLAESAEFIDLEGVNKEPLRPWQMSFYESMPLNALSRLVGKVLNDYELPKWSRKHVIGFYAATFGCNLDEAEVSEPEEYPTLGAFFRRRLKAAVRPIDREAALTSPCDGRVLTCGPVTHDGMLEQIKGVSYPLAEFLGEGHQPKNVEKDSNAKKNLYQVTLYLAPGDYHCFHSPADWTAKHRRHFPGKLLSVRPGVVSRVPNLFSLNERVVYTGEWSDTEKFFAFCAVGATNVGSIVIGCDKQLQTNRKGSAGGTCSENDAQFDAKIAKGEYFGEFNFGSTIVLVFEAEPNFEFKVKNGQRVKVGQAL